MIIMGMLRRIILSTIVTGFCGIAMPVAAQIYVTARPSHPKAVVKHRPVRPVGAVWIEDDWRVHEGHYQFNGRRWETPPGHGMRWRAGHWKSSTRKGYIWVPGRWLSRKYF